MERNFKLFNIIAAILGFAIIASFIVVGSFLDFDISSVLYQPGNEGAYAILGSVLAQAPTFIAVTVAGALFLAASKCKLLDDKKNFRYLLIILGIIGIALGTFFSFYYALKFGSFDSIGRLTTKYFIYVGITAFVALAINGLLVFLVLKYGNKLQFRKAILVAGLIMLIVALEVIFYHALKYLISRPRPRYIFATAEPLRIYQNWWNLSPFKAFSEDEFTSCPSGHCSNAMALPFILVALTYLKPNFKFKYRILAFVIGYLYALGWAMSRVFAGAHFFSDLGIGMLVSYITGIVLWNYFVYKYKVNIDVESVDKIPQENQ